MSSTKLNNVNVAAEKGNTDHSQMGQKKQQKGKGLSYLFSRRKTKTGTSGNMPITPTHSTTTSTFSPNSGEDARKDMTLVSLENKLEQTGKAFAHYEAVHDIMTDIMAKNKGMSFSLYFYWCMWLYMFFMVAVHIYIYICMYTHTHMYIHD